MVLALLALGCSDRLDVGSDLLWSADHETGDLSEWTGDERGGTRLPNEASTVAVSQRRVRSGRAALELVNPANWNNEQLGPELFHAAGALEHAYYSAWFLLPEAYRVEPSLTLVRLRSRDSGSDELFNGEELQLRSLSDGRFVLVVFSNHAGYLLEPVAETAPLVDSARWFHLEAHYEPRSGGHLRVWLDGVLAYDLPERPGSAGTEIAFSVCNVVERSTPAPLALFVDDAAISLSRVSTSGQF